MRHWQQWIGEKLNGDKNITAEYTENAEKIKEIFCVDFRVFAVKIRLCR